MSDEEEIISSPEKNYSPEKAYFRKLSPRKLSPRKLSPQKQQTKTAQHLKRSPLVEINQARKILQASRNNKNPKNNKLGARRRLCLSNFGKKQSQSENNCLARTSPGKTHVPSSKANLLKKFAKKEVQDDKSDLFKRDRESASQGDTSQEDNSQENDDYSKTTTQPTKFPENNSNSAINASKYTKESSNESPHITAIEPIMLNKIDLESNPVSQPKNNPNSTASTSRRHLQGIRSPTKRFSTSKSSHPFTISHSPIRASPRKRTRIIDQDFEDGSTKTNHSYPIDFSIKTSFQLKFPRKFLSELTIQKQSVKAKSYMIHLDDSLITNNDENTELGAKIQRATQFFQFPSIPWFKPAKNEADLTKQHANQQTGLDCFPRYGKTQKLPSLESHQLEGFYFNFQTSLKCLFQMYRNSQVPYFYVFSEAQTIVFKNGECVIWPGNTAMKTKLQTTGIQFSEEQKILPKDPSSTGLNMSSSTDTSDKKGDSVDKTPKTPKKTRHFGRSNSVTEEMLKTPTRRNRNNSENLSTCDEEDDEEYAKTPDIKMKNYRRASANDMVTSQTLQGALVITGTQQCSRFCNLLQKADFWKERVGNAIPPTLLSPYNFENGTLKSSSYSVQTMSGDSERYVLEFGGGILMPHAVWIIIRLIQDHVATKHYEDPSFELHGNLTSEKSSMNLNYKKSRLNDIQEGVEEVMTEFGDSSFLESLRASSQSSTVTKFLFNFSKKFQVL